MDASLIVATTLLALLASTATAASAGNMVGRQSQNEGLDAVPAPGPVTIDGDLSDWDTSGRIQVFADHELRGRYAVEVAAMWDAEHLYLAARWDDPTPMYSTIDPRFNPSKGWMDDAWQLRIKTDRFVHLTSWFYAPRGETCISLSHQGDGGDPRMLELVDGVEFEQGVALAYRMDEDEQGFVQELRLPWRFLYERPPTIVTGHVLRVGTEFLWGGPTGDSWPIHRYADNMQPGVTSREFYWQNWKAWGDVTLRGADSVEPRRYRIADHRPEGSIAVQATIPVDAARFTIAIEDGAGRRVRNLAGDFSADDYEVSRDRDQRLVEVRWDGLDDAGEAVAPGTYTVRGLSHGGIGAAYEMSFYNPGTPPWETADGTGAWGADHVSPCQVARAGDTMVISWKGAEGGSGLIGVATDGSKLWGEKRGATLLAAGAEFAFGLMDGHGNDGHRVLCRYAVADGAYRPFVRDDTELPFELPVSDLVSDEENPVVVALAADDTRIALGLASGRLVLLDAATAASTASHDLPGLSDVAIGPDGSAAAIIDGHVHRLDLATGSHEAWPTPGLATPSGIAIDRDGNCLSFDLGPDRQVKAYTPAGELAYTCGQPGGRPLRGSYEKQGLRPTADLAADAEGRVWTVAKGMDPRRVAIWNRDGSLQRDLVGNTAYAGTGSYLDEHDPDSAFVGSVRMTIDRDTREWEVAEILWAPRPDHGEAFPLWSRAHHFSNPGFVRSSAGGAERSYLYHNGMYSQYHAIHMQRGGCWQPVAAICERQKLLEQLPQLELPPGDKRSIVIWNDTNQDGAVQAEECELLDEQLSIDAGWSHSIGSDLSFVTRGMTRFKPVGFTDDGAPIYGAEGIQRYAEQQSGHFETITEENLILCAGTKHYPNACDILGMDLDTGRVRWRVPNPYPGVHGSHRAPMPRPGLIIGPLKICGSADVGGDIGRVFMLRGNLGQDYFLTADGLIVGAMFRDGRLPSDGLPDGEAALIGAPFDALSNGGEPFSGWFGKQADGVLRGLSGIPRQASSIYRITGMESIQRFEGEPLQLDAAALREAAAEIAARSAAATESTTYPIARIDGDPMAEPSSWDGVASLMVEREGSGESAQIQLARDDQHLFARFAVRDTSPWRNSGKDPARLFKTGDAVDIQLGAIGVDAGADPVAGDQRILIAPFQGDAVAMLMQPVAHGPLDGGAVSYTTGWTRTLAKVARIERARIAVETSGEGYVVTAAIPLADLGLAGARGSIRGDVGFISGDADGRINVARTYWANPETNLVNDEPLEAWLYPANWSRFELE